MHLILLERIAGLGNVGDEVTVRPGYGRNFLLPQGKAVLANSANRKMFERRRATLEAKHRTELEKAQAAAVAMAALKLEITRATSDTKHLYGSVTTNDLAHLLEAAGVTGIARRSILLDHPIKLVGEHGFRVRLHPDVVAEMTVTVRAENA